MLENISKLSQQQIDNFNKVGYIIIKNAISQKYILNARKSYNRMRSKCENGEYNHLRRYNNLSRKDIYAIEDIFNPDIFEEDILTALMESKVLEYSTQLLNEEAFLSLSRLHCTKHFSHAGYWHRDHGMPKQSLDFIDDMIKEQNYIHVQSTLPFYDEDGFYVVPGSHKYSDNYISTDLVMGVPNRKIYENEFRICIKSGDLILFNPLTIHRGSCKGRVKYQRAHIHMRFSKRSAASNIERTRNDFAYYNQSKVLNTANNNWKFMFENNLEPTKFWRKEIIHNKNAQFTFRNNIGLIKNRIKYFISRFIPLSNRKIENINSIIFPYLK